MHPLYGALYVFWWHIDILMRLLSVEPLSTSGLLFAYPCLRGTILLTLFDVVGLAGL